MSFARPRWHSVPAVLLPALFLPSPALAPQAFTILVGAHRAGTFTRIDGRTDALVGTCQVCREPWGVVAGPDGRAAHLACEGEAIRVRLPDLAVAARYPLDGTGMGIAVTADGLHLLTVNNREGAHSLSLIRIPEAREIRRIPVPSAHEQVVLSPDGRKA